MRIGKDALVLGSLQQQKRLEVIANNIANSSTAGYKRDEVRFSDFVNQSTYTHFGQGATRMTDNLLDVALQGDGYFKVQSDKGVVYTRAGNLTLNKDKILTTQEGWPILGKGGPIEVRNSKVRIDPDGQVFDVDEQNVENLVDTLDVIMFPKETALQKIDNGYITPVGGGAEPVAAENYGIQQGALEGANFNVVEEMTRMVETMRAFEAYQKAFQISHHDLDSQVITKLGNS